MSIQVSCLVSVYNGFDFIYGCLSDLVNQTLFKKNSVEIIVIDSASTENITDIIKRFQNEYTNIHYVRTEERETLYAAWNRAISLSKGQYLTNANTDDRHRIDFLEVMASKLEENPKVDLVYADVYKSIKPNQTFDELDNYEILKYPDFSFSGCIFHFQFGCQPMWRRQVHDVVGLFDPSMKAAGDWDFNFRFNLAGRVAQHIGDTMGVFYQNPRSVSVVGNASAIEQTQVRQKYINYQNVIKLLQFDNVETASLTSQSIAISDLATKAMLIKLPWETEGVFTDLGLAKLLFEVASQIDSNNSMASEGLLQCEKLMSQL